MNKKGEKRRFQEENENEVSSEESSASGIEESEDEEMSDDSAQLLETTSNDSDEGFSSNINDVGDEIKFKDDDISDGELSFEEIVSDNDENFLKFVNENDAGFDFKTDENDQSKTNFIQSIRNDSEPLHMSQNAIKANEYEYDSSDEEDVINTIGNIPFEWYKDYIHVGYDVEGRKIIKPPTEDEVEEFLRQMDDPNYGRTIRNNLTGQKVILSDQDVNFVKRIRQSNCPNPDHNLYEPFIDFFSYKKMLHPMTNRPEPKAAFIPSLSEKRIVSRLVSAIKKARLKPKPLVKKPQPYEFVYDLWEKELEDEELHRQKKRRNRHIQAPKMKTPGHAESYNPPPEYLPSKEEEERWQQQEPEERKSKFLPKSYNCLRQVPAYSDFTKERFERCLDLYLCPRVNKRRIQIHPDDLLPQLPSPADLQPFPSIQSMVYNGQTSDVLCLDIEFAGQFVAGGDHNGVLHVWEVLTGRCFKTLSFSRPITNVLWYPNSTKSILIVVVEKNIFLLNIGLGGKQVIAQTDEYFNEIRQSTITPNENDDEKSSVVEWKMIDPKSQQDEWNKGIRLVLEHSLEISQVNWHSAGEYFASVMPTGVNKSVVIHHLSKQKSQVPFKKSKGIIRCVQFHPTKAYFFVSTERFIRVYDLVKQEMTKKLVATTQEISTMAIHPGGDNFIIGTKDSRVQWFDMDLSIKPYKILRYHKRSIRSLAFHRRYPLFASSSDDGTIVVCHGMTYEDLLQNVLIVPVKVLRAFNQSDSRKTVVNNKILQCGFHSTLPWLFGTSSNTIRLFT